MNQPVKFIDYVGNCIAVFEIHPNEFVGETHYQGIVVMCEFNYRDNSGTLLACHRPYTSLDEIQQKFGNRLKLEWVDQCEKLERKTMCFYSFEYGSGNYVLAFPASGEECNFEIYAVRSGRLMLQYSREL